MLSVQKNYNAVQKKPNISMWRPKYIKYCLIGKTYKAIFLYACFYVSALLYYDFAIQDETCEEISNSNVTHLVSLKCFLFNNQCFSWPIGAIKANQKIAFFGSERV